MFPDITTVQRGGIAAETYAHVQFVTSSGIHDTLLGVTAVRNGLLPAYIRNRWRLRPDHSFVYLGEAPYMAKDAMNLQREVVTMMDDLYRLKAMLDTWKSVRDRR